MLDPRSGDEARRTCEVVDGEGDVASSGVAEFCTVVLGRKAGGAGGADGELEDDEVFDLAPDNAAHWQRNRPISPPQPTPPREATTLEIGATATTCGSTGSPGPICWKSASAEVLLKARKRCPTGQAKLAPRLRSHKPLCRASRSMAKRADRFSGFDWADAHEEVVLVEVIDAGNRSEFC